MDAKNLCYAFTEMKGNQSEIWNGINSIFDRYQSCICKNKQNLEMHIDNLFKYCIIQKLVHCYLVFYNKAFSNLFIYFLVRCVGMERRKKVGLSCILVWYRA